MAKRSALHLDDVADLGNLASAFRLAARGKRHRADVQAFSHQLFTKLGRLRHQILAGTVLVGEMSEFQIRDPKPRTIHAPCFRERVLHHALMAKLGPPLERALIDDSFACRRGKGTLAAVDRAQQHSRRFPWLVKLDVRAYFASIPHDRLRGVLRRRIKGGPVLDLCDRILAAHQASPGRGLPIGALTSQHFANLYLGDLDRLILESSPARAMVRYMDDVVLWACTRGDARKAAESVVSFARGRLGLEIKPRWTPRRSEYGLPFCGFRILPERLNLTRRRQRRYRLARQRWERDYCRGNIDGLALQAGYAAAQTIVAHADTVAWRRRDLVRRPPPDA